MNMTKVLKIKKTPEEGIRELLRFLLENERIKGVLTLRKIGKNGAVANSLITDPDGLEDALPLYPLMPTNAGRILSRLTVKGEMKEPIAAVMRPCEIRGFIELVKRQQGSMDNVYIISPTCPGVYPLGMAADDEIDDLKDYWKAAKDEDIDPDIRPACKACESFIPMNADIALGLVGQKDLDKSSIFYLSSKKGEELVEGMKGDRGEEEMGSLDSYLAKRSEGKKKLYEEAGIENLDLDGLIDMFGRCIGCKGCREACPICYCQLCTFDSQDTEYSSSVWESEVNIRGGLRIPSNTVYYHLGRLNHVTISCVGCGACEDACPADIPLAMLFKKVGEEVQAIFDYVPGRDLEEDIPLKTFETEELSEVEN